MKKEEKELVLKKALQAVHYFDLIKSANVKQLSLLPDLSIDQYRSNIVLLRHIIDSLNHQSLIIQEVKAVLATIRSIIE